MVRILPPEPEKRAPRSARPAPGRAMTRMAAALALLALAAIHAGTGQWLLSASAALFGIMAVASAWELGRGRGLPPALLVGLFLAGVAAWAGSCFLPPP